MSMLRLQRIIDSLDHAEKDSSNRMWHLKEAKRFAKELKPYIEALENSQLTLTLVKLALKQEIDVNKPDQPDDDREWERMR